MLQIEIANTVNEYDLKGCILKHRHIFSYAENVIKIARFVILTTAGIAITLIEFGGFLLVYVNVVAIIQLFVNSYSVGNLIEMSSATGSAVYNLNWVEKLQKMSKNILFLIQRSQKPVIIRINGFLPILSSSYYMSFLSSSFSYFMTMRALIN
ncbi:putative odorant receptor 92a [Polistes fuscatus]|uniref:putative odorant receptor 92a n=1 Tax=Polistes fuscatus TaxID=30207 RepID=UPI001CA8BC0D|nr:putative odorant receptor 92a [Polistes fuscatus]